MAENKELSPSELGRALAQLGKNKSGRPKKTVRCPKCKAEVQGVRALKYDHPKVCGKAPSPSNKDR